MNKSMFFLVLLISISCVLSQEYDSATYGTSGCTQTPVNFTSGSCGASISVESDNYDFRLTQVSMFWMPFGTNVKLVIVNHPPALSANVHSVYNTSVPQALLSSGTWTTTTFLVNITLLAGKLYDIGVVIEGYATICVNNTVVNVTSKALQHNALAANISSYNNPIVSNHLTTLCPMRLYGNNIIPPTPQPTPAPTPVPTPSQSFTDTNATPTSASNPTNSSTDNGSNDTQNSAIESSPILSMENIYIIAGAGGGGLILCCIFFIIICVCVAKRKKRNQEPNHYGGAPELEIKGVEVKTSGKTASRSGSKSSFAREFEIRYEDLILGQELGRGSFGCVYLATYRFQPVAVKVMLNSQNPGINKDDFLAEAATWSRIKQHKHVVNFIGVTQDSERLAIVSEYVENGTVERYYKKNKQVELDKAIKWASQTCLGMIHLAADAIVHRDLSCRNLLLDRENSIKISDFGMAREVSSEEEQTRSNIGPMRWMAPENLLNKTYSTKSDVWSFSMTVMEMLICDHPFPSFSMVDAAKAVCQKIEHPIPEHTPELLIEILRLCWTYDAKDRPTFSEIWPKFQELAKDQNVNLS